MSKKDFGDQLSKKARRCGGLLHDSPLECMHSERVLPAIRQQVRHPIAENPKLEYSEVVNFTQRCGEARRRMCRFNKQLRTTLYCTRNRAQPRRQVLTIGTQTDAELLHQSNAGLDVELQILALQEEGYRTPPSVGTLSTNETTTRRHRAAYTHREKSLIWHQQDLSLNGSRVL